MNKIKYILVAACVAVISAAFADISDYKLVEYVQATHSQYINTGYRPNANTTIDLAFSVDDYQARELTTSGSLSDRSNAYVLACYYDRCQFAYGSTCFMGFGGGNQDTNYDNPHIKMTSDTNIHRMGLTNSVFYIDGVQKYDTGRQGVAFSQAVDLYAFALNASGTPKYLCAAKIYSLVISENGTEVCHFVPAKDSQGNPGLYDLVGRSFKASATTTPLVAGPEIEPPSEDPKFSGFSAGGDLSHAWEQVTVSDGAEFGATVEAYMGTDPASWTVLSNWTHSVASATYAMTNGNVAIGQTYYCAFKMTYEKDSETIVKWTLTNQVAISGTVHWSGAGADTKWTTVGNWQEGFVPNSQLTARFSQTGSTLVTAGDEALSTKGFYVTKGTTVLDFQPETTLAMTYLHLGDSTSPATAANLVVSNGVINSTGSISFDYSRSNAKSSLTFVGTKANFDVKLYQQNSNGSSDLNIIGGSSVKMPAYQSAGNAGGGDRIFVGEDSSLVLTGGSDNTVDSSIPANSTIIIDGGAWTNDDKFAFVTSAGCNNLLVIKNGGVFSHRPNVHLSSGNKRLSLAGRGSTFISATDGGLFEVLYELRFGDGADNYAARSEIAVTNGTFKCGGAVTIGYDSRCKANYKVTVSGEQGLLDAQSTFTLGSTSYAGGTRRNAGSAMLLVDGGTARIGGALKLGAEYEGVTDTLKVMGSTAKVTANSIACTTNAVINFVVPENGYVNESVVSAVNNIALSDVDGKPTPILIDASACRSSEWQTLMQSTGGEIQNISDEQVSVTGLTEGRTSELRLVKNGEDKVTALQFRVLAPAARGMVIIYR